MCVWGGVWVYGRTVHQNSSGWVVGIVSTATVAFLFMTEVFAYFRVMPTRVYLPFVGYTGVKSPLQLEDLAVCALCRCCCCCLRDCARACSAFVLPVHVMP